jgi:pilus assembly protein CpaC
VTKVFVFSTNGAVSSYVVQVGRSTGAMSAAISNAAPGAAVSLTGTPNGVVMSGTVPNALDALRLRAAAGQFLTNGERPLLNVGVTGSTQVNLRVRVAEVSRNAMKRFGFNWDALFNNGMFAMGLMTGRPTSTAFGSFIRDTSVDQLDSLGIGYKSGSLSVSTLIDALQTEGLVTVLAEPNLTAVSGEPANFLAGGEFPVPVSQSLQEITIEWKRFGVSVEFTPTVLDPNRISVKVRPEVSELSDSGAVVVNNIKVPALTVRRAETTVELGSGQSFAIAGLFQNNVQSEVQQFPWLADLPVLGALFRSTSFKRHETELVIIVTPYIVRPASGPGDLHLPTEGIVYASDLERLLMGHLTSADGASTPPPPVSPDHPHLSGAAGLIME